MYQWTSTIASWEQHTRCSKKKKKVAGMMNTNPVLRHNKNTPFRSKLPRLPSRSGEEMHSTIWKSSWSDFISMLHFRKRLSHPSYSFQFKIEEGKELYSCASWPLAILQYTQSHWLNNLFRFTDTKTAFVTCQLSVVPPLGHWSKFL